MTSASVLSSRVSYLIDFYFPFFDLVEIKLPDKLSLC